MPAFLFKHAQSRAPEIAESAENGSAVTYRLASATTAPKPNTRKSTTGGGQHQPEVNSEATLDLWVACSHATLRASSQPTPRGSFSATISHQKIIGFGGNRPRAYMSTVMSTVMSAVGSAKVEGSAKVDRRTHASVDTEPSRVFCGQSGSEFGHRSAASRETCNSASRQPATSQPAT